MKPRILIIDDEPEIRELYRNFLETEEYEIHEAQNGQEAFRMAGEKSFDLYITDIMMPEMNGVDFMKVLKMIDPDAVVIIVTGYDDMEYTREALNYGAFRFLTKPINMKEFLQVVELGLIERRQLFRTTNNEKLKRLKDKLNSNPDLQEKVFNKLEDFLLYIEQQGASYIEMGGHGSKGRIWAKIKNRFLPFEVERSFNQDEINIMILSILSKEELDMMLKNKFLKFNHEFQADDVLYRYRVKAYFELNEMVVCIKPTRREVMPMEKLALPSAFLNRVSMRNDNAGLVIFTGPTGSGKSTMIDALVNYNNENGNGSIFILSDSIEYYHDSMKSLVRQQEIHSDVNSLVEGLKSCLDYNPDLVVIEDIRYADVAETVFKLVDSGSMVYATMRSKSTTEAIQKILNLFPAGEQDQLRVSLSGALNSIVSVQLVPGTKQPMVLAKEVFMNTSQTKQAIQNNNINELYTLIMQGQKSGMQTMEQDLYALSRKGLITTEVALESAHNRQQLREMLQYR